jgi:hypothetical protein
MASGMACARPRAGAWTPQGTTRKAIPQAAVLLARGSRRLLLPPGFTRTLTDQARKESHQGDATAPDVARRARIPYMISILIMVLKNVVQSQAGAETISQVLDS